MVKDLLVHERSCPERTVECPDPDNNCGSIVEFVLFYCLSFCLAWWLETLEEERSVWFVDLINALAEEGFFEGLL